MPAARFKARGTGRVLEIKGLDKFSPMTDCVIPAGVRVATADRVRLGAHLPSGTVMKAKELSGKNGILFRRDSQSGALHAILRNKSWDELNAELHKN